MAGQHRHLTGLIVIAINLVVDVSYAVIDPRIRPGRRAVPGGD